MFVPTKFLKSDFCWLLQTRVGCADGFLLSVNWGRVFIRHLVVIQF